MTASGKDVFRFELRDLYSVPPLSGSPALFAHFTGHVGPGIRTMQAHLLSLGLCRSLAAVGTTAVP